MAAALASCFCTACLNMLETVYGRESKFPYEWRGGVAADCCGRLDKVERRVGTRCARVSGSCDPLAGNKRSDAPKFIKAKSIQQRKLAIRRRLDRKAANECNEGCASAQCRTHSTRTNYKWKDALQRSVAAARDRPCPLPAAGNFQWNTNRAALVVKRAHATRKTSLALHSQTMACMHNRTVEGISLIWMYE